MTAPAMITSYRTLLADCRVDSPGGSVWLSGLNRT
jgi:hypothetical protein